MHKLELGKQDKPKHSEIQLLHHLKDNKCTICFHFLWHAHMKIGRNQKHVRFGSAVGAYPLIEKSRILKEGQAERLVTLFRLTHKPYIYLLKFINAG